MTRVALFVLFIGLVLVSATEPATPTQDTGPGTKTGTTQCVDPSKLYSEIFKKCLPKQESDGFTGHSTGALATGAQSSEDLKLSAKEDRRQGIILMPGSVRAYIPMTIFGKPSQEIEQKLEKESKDGKEVKEDGEEERSLRVEAFRGGGGGLGFGRGFGHFGGPGFGFGGFGAPFAPYGRFGRGSPFGFGGPFGSPYGFPYGGFPFGPPVVPVPVDGGGGLPTNGGNFGRGANMTLGRLQSGKGAHGVGSMLIMPGAVQLDMPIVVYGAFDKKKDEREPNATPTTEINRHT